MSTVKVKGNGSDVVKLFRFIEDVIMPPEALSKKKKHLKWSFNIDQGCISLLAQANISSDGARSTRIIQSGSRLCRIRCIRLASTAGLPSQGEWVVADHTWPDGVGIILNGKSHEVRKNSHHGKDLSIDITQFIRSGKNELTTALIGLPEGSSLRYAIGVELIRVEEEMDIKRAIPMARLEEARKRILEHSSQIDPDVQVIHAPTIINLTDPFTASQFEIPLRGSNCRHYQCFDRDVFLETRNAKDPDQPCEPEAFKCPICGLDARPPNLVIDGFLLAVKDSLQKQGRDKVKAVILREDGEWEIEKEDEATGESDDETDKQDWPQAEKLAEAGAGKASEAGQRTSREVIEIDD